LAHIDDSGTAHRPPPPPTSWLRATLRGPNYGLKSMRRGGATMLLTASNGDKKLVARTGRWQLDAESWKVYQRKSAADDAVLWMERVSTLRKDILGMYPSTEVVRKESE
jgi:hypothetical protein